MSSGAAGGGGGGGPMSLLVTLELAHPPAAGAGARALVELLLTPPARGARAGAGGREPSLTFVSVTASDAAAGAGRARGPPSDAWADARGAVAEHHRAATEALCAAFREEVVQGGGGGGGGGEGEGEQGALCGAALRARVAALGAALRRVGALCAEVAALREASPWPCRFLRPSAARAVEDAAGGACCWEFAADIGVRERGLRLRLVFALEPRAAAAYPTRPFACTVVWVAGESRAASAAVSRAVQAAQAAFAASPAARAAPGAAAGALRAIIKAADQALRASP
jgi:hypothetical protein